MDDQISHCNWNQKVVVGILCFNSRHDYWKFLDIVPYQQSTGKSLPWLICVSTRNSKRVSEDICFIWQSAWSPPRKYFMNLGMNLCNELRYDRVDYYQSHFEKQKRCGHCAKNARKGCSKYGVGIHNHCFQEWYCVVWYRVTLKYS